MHDEIPIFSQIIALADTLEKMAAFYKMDPVLTLKLSIRKAKRSGGVESPRGNCHIR